MTDPPLMNALLSTKPEVGEDGIHTRSVQRLTLLRINTDGRPSEEYGEEHTFRERRLEHFGVDLIALDHYVQVSQFLTELNIAMRHGSPAYSDARAPHRYGARLIHWWNDWLFSGQGLQVRQASHHRYLERRLPIIRALLDAKSSEPLKLEVWLRWSPADGRRLRLWASSIGTWEDERSMREGTIRGDSEYVSVRAFCLGSSILTQENASDRWKTYLATPLWWSDAYNAEFPVGVVSLASMWPDSESSIGSGHVTEVSAALLEMHRVGIRIARPES